MGVLSFMMMSASVYLTNAYADIEIDSINKPYRPQVTGKVSRNSLKYSSIIFGLLSIVLASFVSRYFLLALALALIVGIAYSLEPFRLKRHYLGIFLTMAVGGSISYVAGWLLISSIFIKQFIYIIVVEFFWTGLFSQIKDLLDIKGDAIFGIKTLPISLGVEKACKIFSISALLSLVAFLIFGIVVWMSSNDLLPIILGIIQVPFSVAIFKYFQMNNSQIYWTKSFKVHILRQYTFMLSIIFISIYKLFI